MRCANLKPCGRALVLALLLVTSACASLQLDKGPGVSLAGFKLTDVTLFETAGLLTVRLANENLETMIVTGGAFNLRLNGVKIGQGLSDQRVEVPKLGTAILQLELHVSNLALASRIRGLIEAKVVDYRLKGKVYVQRPTGTRRYKVLKDGHFDLSESLAAGG